MKMLVIAAIITSIFVGQLLGAQVKLLRAHVKLLRGHVNVMIIDIEGQYLKD